MTEYFAVLDDDDRRGPFDTMQEPVALLKANSKARGHTDEQAQHYFLNQSAVEQVETVEGKVECIRLGWMNREKSGSQDHVGQVRRHPNHPAANGLQEGRRQSP